MARHRSLWLQQALEREPDDGRTPPLRGAARADIAIVGGGYVGLWTAIRIKEREPSREVVVLEQDICGGGASGRNGGFVLSWSLKLPSLLAHFGEADARRLYQQSVDAVAEIGRFCATHRIDADYHQNGYLWTATSHAQLGAWDGALNAAERLGIAAFEPLDRAELRRRTGSDHVLGGVLDPTGALVHPAWLARGLRRVALDMGVRIHEGTRVLAIDRKAPVAVRSAQGLLAADTLVVATNAWAAGLREMATKLVVVTSDMAATAPIPERIRAIGWTGGEAITNSHTMVDYFRVTHDGRIAFGKSGWSIALAGRIGPTFDRNPRWTPAIARRISDWFPSLADVPITHDWCGPIDRSPDGLPLIGRLGGRPHILYGVGWSGNGVGPSVLGGRILASLALDADDDWSRHPLVDRRTGNLPPEPVRYLGAHVVRSAVLRKEEADDRGAPVSRLDRWLASLVPAGLEDKGDGAGTHSPGSPHP